MNFKTLDSLQEDDLTPDLKLLLGACDMETVRKVLFSLQATQLYIPRIASLHSFVSRNAMAESNNKSSREIALEIGVSRRHLENLLKKARKKKFEALKSSITPLKKNQSVKSQS